VLSVVIPLYNEDANVGPMVEKTVADLEELGQPFEIILINDGSQDNTGRELARAATADQRIKVINFRRNFGQTAAMMAGFDAARGEIVVCMDGDLQNDSADIGRLLAKLDKGYDVVSGWRKNRKDNTLWRTFPSHVANKLISFVLGVKLHDFGCSLKAYRRDVIMGVRLYGEMHRFIPVYAAWQGAKVTEIEVTHHPRLHGRSKYGLRRVFKVVLDLMLLKYFDRYMAKSIYVFGGIGLLLLLLSLIITILAAYLRFFVKGMGMGSLPVMAAMFFITGVTCILMGFLSEILTRTYFESQGKAPYQIRDSINLDHDRQD
jgi:glycosyltransferase involved in cell wall biosynthesis